MNVKVRSSRDDSPVEVERTKEAVEITFGDPETLRTRKAQKQLAGSILALYEISANERTPELRRQRFSELLLALLSRW
jgi:hypothetical protein